MTEILPYRMGMILGRTYDLRTHSIGEDIFSEEYTANPQIMQCPSTTIRYSVIKNSSDVNNVLDVSGDISLKVKAGILDVKGMGSYLKEKRIEDNTLEILVVAHVETLSTMMKPQPVCNRIKNKIFTHYIRTITYGGDLVISMRIIASDAKDLEQIKATVEAGIKVHGIVDAEGKANFKQMEQHLKGSSTIKFSYYCTTPCIKLPTDVDSMLRALDDFQNQLGKINDGKGAPLRCELVPLNSVDSNLSTVLRQTGLEVQLRELEEMYDEIKEAKSILQKFLEDAVEYMREEQCEKASEIENRIQNVMSRFNKVISTLDVTTDGDGPGQIQHAADYYRQNKKLGGFRTEVKIFLKHNQPHISTGASRTPVEKLPLDGPLSILLLGINRHGKTATANSIIGEKKFGGHYTCDSSMTYQTATRIIGGREISLMDISGTKNTKQPLDVFKNVGSAIAQQSRGFHALILVLSINVRITKDELNWIMMLKKVFGEDILVKYGIVVFTHGDEFREHMEERKENKTFREHIRSRGGNEEIVLKECKDRCALINNMEEDSKNLQAQVNNIIELIERLVANNDGTKCTKYII